MLVRIAGEVLSPEVWSMSHSRIPKGRCADQQFDELIQKVIWVVVKIMVILGSLL